MKIIHARPPNFDTIRKFFPMADKPGVIFAYNGAIYVPCGSNVSEPLQAHEAVHCKRQGNTEDSTIEWWDTYLRNAEFRYNEELLAHRAEYFKAIEISRNRNQKRHALKSISKKLAAPLYGRMVTRSQARNDILGDK